MQALPVVVGGTMEVVEPVVLLPVVPEVVPPPVVELPAALVLPLALPRVPSPRVVVDGPVEPEHAESTTASAINPLGIKCSLLATIGTR
jgi:hypothetical protein